MIATTEVEARHSIPGCIYSIHSSSVGEIDSGRPAGKPIRFARIGDRILHQWHCDDRKSLLETALQINRFQKAKHSLFFIH